MAKLLQLPQYDIISGFKGNLDFYIWNVSCDKSLGIPGIPCVRRWPRPPSEPRSAGVQAGWSDWSYVSRLWSQLSPAVQSSWRRMAGNGGLNGRDLFTRAYLKGIYQKEH